MLSVRDPEILSLVPDYRINLFSPAEIKDEKLDKLQSNLKEVMLFIKYSKDKRKLQELTSKNSGFQSLELKAARVQIMLKRNASSATAELLFHF